jgi:hypothetical protein
MRCNGANGRADAGHDLFFADLADELKGNNRR